MCALQCSRTCGDGVQLRRVACQDGHGTSSAECNVDDRPADNQACHMGPCPRWNHGDWSSVSQANFTLVADRRSVILSSRASVAADRPSAANRVRSRNSTEL